jgi:branched-chain amino acid transport system permease protein
MEGGVPHRRKERIDRGIKLRSESIYALSSAREMAYLLAPRLLLVVGFLALPMVLDPWPYWVRVVSSVCVLALLAISFDFLANYVGLVCLGGAFFYGVGGYATALLSTGLGLPPAASIVSAAVLGAALCTLVLTPCLPLRGIYFAIVTLMVPLLMTRIIEAADILGGTPPCSWSSSGCGASWPEIPAWCSWRSRTTIKPSGPPESTWRG